jgi:uncharacterized membrane protein
MAKKKIQILPLILFTLGVYFIYKKVQSSGIVSPSKNGKSEQLEDVGVSKYMVDTKSGNLNVRNKASTTSPIQRQMKKGEIFYGKITSDGNWISIVDTNQLSKVMGYVSSLYVKKL